MTEEEVVIWIYPDLDEMVSACFFHGKESGPVGTKSIALKAIDMHLICPDFRGKSLAERLEIAETKTRNFPDPLLLVGSSMGGLVAALLYQKYPERFFSLLLLAPALHWAEAKAITRLPENTVVIHGEQDTVVPFESSVQWQQKLGFELIRVEDDHRLNHSLELITTQFKKLLGKAPWR